MPTCNATENLLRLRRAGTRKQIELVGSAADVEATWFATSESE